MHETEQSDIQENQTKGNQNNKTELKVIILQQLDEQHNKIRYMYIASSSSVFVFYWGLRFNETNDIACACYTYRNYTTQ